MTSITVLEWTYSPSNYFEAPMTLSRDNYKLTIQNGKVEAKLDTEHYEKNPNIESTIESSLNLRFQGVQLLSHRAYQLTYAGWSRLYPDGRKDVTISPCTATATAMACIADIVVTKKDGSVYDSRKERIQKKAELAELAEKHGATDKLARALLDSYSIAVTDTANELIHLYEVRDALAKNFGGEGNACKALGISKADWSKLGQIANDEPLNQGRHRGAHAGILRDATETELQEARNISQSFILAYLNYLNKVST